MHTVKINDTQPVETGILKKVPVNRKFSCIKWFVGSIYQCNFQAISVKHKMLFAVMMSRLRF